MRLHWHQLSAVCRLCRAAKDLFSFGNQWLDNCLSGLQELKAHKEAIKKLGKKRKVRSRSFRGYMSAAG